MGEMLTGESSKPSKVSRQKPAAMILSQCGETREHGSIKS